MSDNSFQDPSQQTPAVITGKSWLATCVFLFTTVYLHFSLSTPFFTADSMLFFVMGVIIAKLAIDLPFQINYNNIVKKMIEGKEGSELRRAADKAGMFATFVKAAIVVGTFTATKYAYEIQFMG